MSITSLLPPFLGVLGLVAAYFIYQTIMKYSEGDEKIAKIGHEIHLGAMVFMAREYKMLLMFASVLVVVLWGLLGIQTAIAFIVGAAASGLAGFIGMYTATKANVRTTTAAHEDGAAQALSRFIPVRTCSTSCCCARGAPALASAAPAAAGMPNVSTGAA